MFKLQKILPLTLLVLGAASSAFAFDDTEMVLIPAGQFEMGCNISRASELCEDNTKPAHTVKLDAYKIDKYEATFRRYKACVDAGECTEAFPGGACNWGFKWNDKHPVNCVDHNQAQEMCAFEGKRLPTEAEWEKAARGNQDQRIFPWGDESASCNRVVMDENGPELPMPGCGAGKTKPVNFAADAGASPYGVVGMSGNLWEMTADWYSENYYANSPRNNPEGPGSGTYKVVRGGAWTMRSDHGLTSILRFGYSPQGQGYVIGFRCAQDVAN